MLNLQYEQEAEHRIIRQEGVDEGKIAGREEERAKAEAEKIEIARKMVADKLPLKTIAEYTGLSIEIIKKL